jgi:iron complex outermembrane receptor protein
MDRRYRDSTATVGPLDLFVPVYGSPVGAFESTYRWDVESSAVGLYLQEQATLGRVTLLAGGRLDLTWSTIHEGTPDPSATMEGDDAALSPRVGLVYEIVPGVSAYASYSRSFLPQQGYLQADGSQVDPEKGEQWEVGLKSRLLAERLIAGLAVYQLTRENVATTDPDNPNFYRVVGKQRSRGVELDATIRLLPGWNLLLAYAYTDAKIVSDNDLPAGDRTQNVPRHALSAWTKYEIQDGALKGLGLGVGGRYYSSQAADLPNTFELPAYGLIDAAVYYTRGPWRFQVNVDNVLDKRYFPAAFSREYVLPGEPRSVSASLTWRFDVK